MPTLTVNPLSILDNLGAEVKALAKRHVPFATNTMGNTQWGGLNYMGLDGRGSYTIGSPGAANDYTALAGNLLNNRVVAACVSAKSTALADAPVTLETLQGDQWERVSGHPVIDLLNKPNAYHGYSDLWGATCANEDTQGQAFWRLEFDRGGTPAEIWVEPSTRFVVLGNANQYISSYRFQTETGAVMELEDKEVIHFRRALHHYNARLGWSPISAGMRQVTGDNAAATYHSAILRNSGVMSLLISTRDTVTAGNSLSPDQMQAFVTAVKHKLFGEGAGGIIGQNIPLDVKNLAFSPDEMMVDKLISYYEASICALLGVDPMVVGLGSGTMQKTYANMSEALNDFWERCILPTKTRHAATLNTQLLPLFGLDPAKFRIAFDYSKVAALQENEDQKHTRVREDYKAGLYDLYAAQQGLGMEPDEDLKGTFYTPPPKPGGDGAPDEAGVPAAKSWEAKRFDPNQPRDEDGRWGAGGTGGTSSTSANKGEMRPATDDERKKIGIPPAYTDVLITDDPGADLKATAKSGKGKVQYYYSPEYSKKQAAAKFNRVKEIHNALPEMRKSWNAEIAANGPNYHEALTLRLISQTGFRVGGLDGGGDVEARGASSLKMSDVSVHGNRVDFDFTGKGGHKQQHSLNDPVIAGHIRGRQAAGADTVFDTNDAKVRDYLKRTGGDFKVHDLRTRTASAMAAHYVGTLEKTGNAPRSEKEYKAARNAIADKVATKLGDTRSVVLSSYIAPQVWQDWESKL